MAQTELVYPSDLIGVDDLADADTRVLIAMAREGDPATADRCARQLAERELAYPGRAYLDLAIGDVHLRAGNADRASWHYERAIHLTGLRVNQQLRLAAAGGHYGLSLVALHRADIWTTICELRDAVAIVVDARGCRELEARATQIHTALLAMQADARQIMVTHAAVRPMLPT